MTHPLHWLSADLQKKVQFLAYRYRFLLSYVLIGVFSLCAEVAVYRGLEHFGPPIPLARVGGLLCGVFLAYWLNVRFNFKVPTAKRRRALLFFVSISGGSALVQLFFWRKLATFGWSYETARFFISGIVFSFAYLLHRRYSFSDLKRVGVAIYANGVEDVRGIFARIGNFPDFIHVDLVDESRGATGKHSPEAFRTETIRAYWPHHEIEAHIMSRTPGRWIPAVAPHVDIVLVDIDIAEDLEATLAAIRAQNRRCGICLTLDDDLHIAEQHAHAVDVVLVLSVATRGLLGQPFDYRALEMLAAINRWPTRRHFDLCVDGGINEKVIGLLIAERVVSGSSVLMAADPRRQIMRLQTSSQYERV